MEKQSLYRYLIMAVDFREDFGAHELVNIGAVYCEFAGQVKRRGLAQLVQF